MVEFLSLAFLKKLLANFSKTTKITYQCLLQKKVKRKTKTKNNFFKTSFSTASLIQNLSKMNIRCATVSISRSLLNT